MIFSADSAPISYRRLVSSVLVNFLFATNFVDIFYADHPSRATFTSLNRFDSLDQQPPGIP